MLESELGYDWRSKFETFDLTPIASASIGQVHSATLSTGQRVAVKIQFPGIAQAINSDLSNIAMLLSFSSLLPKGLYLENSLEAMRSELIDECDYVQEAASAKIFRNLLQDDSDFSVPTIVADLSTARILTAEYMHGVPINKVTGLSAPQRNHVSSERLCFVLL